ncbi:MAG TPA: SDR family oxidoreductase [Tissierellia bacterium]|nr:SDR family oxidoreductase [Tissierellia bacterium]
MRLENKTAIITGAASGIGAAAVEKFAQNGANVAMWDINEKGLLQLEKKLEKYDVKIKSYKVDTTDYENVQEAGRLVVKDFGKVDILVNCVGGGKYLNLGIRELDEEKWKNQIDLNLNSAFYCTKSIIEHMIERNYGKIVNISSVAGMRGGGLLGRGAYATAKAGIIGFTKAVAKEFAEYGIYANTIAPALHVTPLIESKMDENQIEKLKNSFLLKSAGQLEKLAELIVFLASDDAQFITGALYTVDGGYSMH